MHTCALQWLVIIVAKKSSTSFTDYNHIYEYTCINIHVCIRAYMYLRKLHVKACICICIYACTCILKYMYMS